jgi:hypothetical protein
MYEHTPTNTSCIWVAARTGPPPSAATGSSKPIQTWATIKISSSSGTRAPYCTRANSVNSPINGDSACCDYNEPMTVIIERYRHATVESEIGIKMNAIQSLITRNCNGASMRCGRTRASG